MRASASVAEVTKLVVPPEIAQAIADEENAEQERKAEGRPSARPTSPAGRHGREAIPQHLPTERIEVDVPEPLPTCACCGKASRIAHPAESRQATGRPGRCS
jgi:hypothetical protein